MLSHMYQCKSVYVREVYLNAIRKEDRTRLGQGGGEKHC